VTPIGIKQFIKTQIKVVVDVVSDLDSGEKALNEIEKELGLPAMGIGEK
jgi:hypothetical protein